MPQEQGSGPRFHLADGATIAAGETTDVAALRERALAGLADLSLNAPLA